MVNKWLCLTDENECTKSQMCPNGQCVNLQGDYQCLCLPGFKSSANKKYCIGKAEVENSTGLVVYNFYLPF